MEFLSLLSWRSEDLFLDDSPSYNCLGVFSPPHIPGRPQKSLALLFLNSFSDYIIHITKTLMRRIPCRSEGVAVVGVRVPNTTGQVPLSHWPQVCETTSTSHIPAWKLVILSKLMILQERKGNPERGKITKVRHVCWWGSFLERRVIIK